MSVWSDKIARQVALDLSPQQRDVVAARGRVVVVAAPGSGKTKTVAYRVAQLLARRDSNVGGVAVLSFTNNAVEEIIAQLAWLGVNYPVPIPHFIGTIDSFLTQQVFGPYAHAVMGCGRAPQIVGPDQDSLLDRYLSAKARSISMGRGVRPRDVNLPSVNYLPDGNLDLQQLFEGVPYWARKQYPIRDLVAAKEAYARDGLATHSDVVYWCYRLVTAATHHYIVDALRSRYSYWMLDEAQDTSELHERLLRTIWSGNSSLDLLVIGDPDQSIYEWNKAKPDYLIQLQANRGEGWTSLLLTDNWRSSQLICNATHPFRNPILCTSPSTAMGPDAACSVPSFILEFPIAVCADLPDILSKVWAKNVGHVPGIPSLSVVAWSNYMVSRIRGADS